MSDVTMDDLLRKEGYVRISAAAKAAGVHVTTLYHLLDAKKVGERRAGAHRYIHAESLAAYYGGGVIGERVRGLLKVPAEAPKTRAR